LENEKEFRESVERLYQLTSSLRDERLGMQIAGPLFATLPVPRGLQARTTRPFYT
jgi:hypothetical protein